MPPPAVGNGTETVALVEPCVPDTLMWLNVSYDTDWVALHPGLAYPDVQARRAAALTSIDIMFVIKGVASAAAE